MSIRMIVVDGQTYQYTVGRSYVRVTYTVDGNRYSKAFDMSEVTGLDHEAIERAKRKRYLSVTPADIEALIRRNIA